MAMMAMMGMVGMVMCGHRTTPSHRLPRPPRPPRPLCPPCPPPSATYPFRWTRRGRLHSNGTRPRRAYGHHRHRHRHRRRTDDAHRVAMAHLLVLVVVLVPLAPRVNTIRSARLRSGTIHTPSLPPSQPASGTNATSAQPSARHRAGTPMPMPIPMPIPMPTPTPMPMPTIAPHRARRRRCSMQFWPRRAAWRVVWMRHTTHRGGW